MTPADARLELGNVVGWLLLFLAYGIYVGSLGPTNYGNLWVDIAQLPWAVLIPLNMMLAGILLVLPFAISGIVLAGHGHGRVIAGAVLACAFALLFAVMAVGTFVGMLGTLDPGERYYLLDLLAAPVLFGACAVMHAASGILAWRRAAVSR